MSLNEKETLLYWILERESVRLKKEAGFPKPWSDDPIFQQTYFCNVEREYDTVTKGIREMYSPFVNDPMFEYNIVLARFLNYMPTLKAINYRQSHDPELLENQLTLLAADGKIWGGAYIVTTHGIAMPKVRYLCQNVLDGFVRWLPHVKAAIGTRSLATLHTVLQQVEGIGSFMSGQIIADLKNTKGHPCFTAEDWWEFVAAGPGSIKGLNWFLGRKLTHNPKDFEEEIEVVRSYLHRKAIPLICNQNLQNCLCEYDKYMRIKTGVGRSKRRYLGV